LAGVGAEHGREFDDFAGNADADIRQRPLLPG
jgi:hypothetical protein